MELRLTDEATGEPPVLSNNDCMEWTHTAWLTDDGIVQGAPDAIDINGEPVQLVNVIRG